MARSQEASVAIGLGIAAVVYAIHQNLTPDLADVRVGEAHDPDVSAAEKTATAFGLIVSGAVGLLLKDVTAGTIGAATTIMMAWAYRHANAVDPATGRIAPHPESTNPVAFMPDINAEGAFGGE